MKRRLHIAVVLTRELNVAGGRPAVLRNLITALARNHDVELIRLRNVLELDRAVAFARMFFAWIASVIRVQPLPLQCALYADWREVRAVYTRISEGRFDAVYLDTIRCQMLLRAVRRGMPGQHVISDFDDLMSRRMALMHDQNLPLETGNIAATAPPWLKRFLSGPAAHFVSWYEAAALTRSESEAVGLSHGVVLVSAYERDELRRRLPASLHGRIYCVPPMMPMRSSPGRGPRRRRFVFIGSDRLLQNRAAIDRLIAMWRRLRPSTALHIFGEQSRAVQAVDGVNWRGAVPDLSKVYEAGSILLLPAPFGGGCKTKVAEAWAFGCPVLGNAAAFEGFALAGYPLNLPESAWDDYICRPEEFGSVWAASAQAGRDFVARNLSPPQFAAAWEKVIMPPAYPADSKDRESFAEARPALDIESGAQAEGVVAE